MTPLDAFNPSISPASTSYFSSPSSELDPNLFQGDRMKDWVRSGILSLLFDHLGTRYANPHKWVHTWIAGSGVSYQWEAQREPGDLDCLVGVDYIEFRRANGEYQGYSDQEIASTLNEGFNKDLMPNTRNWEGYELTFYVNVKSDIRDINPYAAYDLISDSWTVYPEKSPQPPYSRDWEQRTNRDHATAVDLVGRYSSALNEVRNAVNPAHRINAESKLRLATDQASVFYDDIHAGRKTAFAATGSGYSDYNNYRWQAGKRSGAVQALRSIKEHEAELRNKNQVNTYGIELPDTNTLLRRSMHG